MVTIKTINFYDKKPRKNDTILIMMEKKGLIKKRYVKVGKCLYTDSLGEVKVKLFKNEIYRFESCGMNPMFSSDKFANGNLKNNSLIVIEVKPENEIQI